MRKESDQTHFCNETGCINNISRNITVPLFMATYHNKETIKLLCSMKDKVTIDKFY